MNVRRAGILVAAVAIVVAGLWLWTATPPAPGPAVGPGGASTRVTPREPAAAVPSPADAGPVPTVPTLRLPPAQVEQAPELKAGALSGRVVSAATGLPVVNAEVTLSGPQGGASSLVSDRDGRFDFVAESPGTYQVASARAAGFVPFGPEWGRSPIAVVVQPGTRVRELVIALRPTRAVTVTVRDATGDPVSGASARVLYANAGEASLYPQRERFTTDEAGQFRLEASEETSVEAWHPRHGSGSAVIDEQAIAAGVVELLLRASDDVGRAKLSGRVELPDGSGAPGALIWVRSANSAFPKTYGNPQGHRAIADQDGNFGFEDVEHGLYDVSAHLTGYGPARVTDLRIPSSALKLKLEGGATLSGTVRDEAGAPVPAFAIDLRWNKGPLEAVGYAEGTFVGPAGQYAIAGLREGRYTMHVFANGFVAKQTRVDVPAGATELKADVTVERGGAVSGRVISGGSRTPVAGARVGVEGLFAGSSLGPAYNAMTDQDGRFVIEGVPTAGASLFVSAPGHNSKVLRAAPGTIEVELTRSEPDAGPKVELVGVGAVLKPREDALVVGQVIPGGGAAEAGLAPGDELVTIDGKAVVDIGWPAAVEVIRGQAGTQVIFGVRKGGQEPVVQVTVTRRKLGA